MIPHEGVIKVLGDYDSPYADEYIDACLELESKNQELIKLNENIDFVEEIARQMQLRQRPLDTRELENTRTVARLDFISLAHMQRYSLNLRIEHLASEIDNFHAAYQEKLFELAGTSIVSPRE